MIAFVDESGVSARSDTAPKHFVVSAVVVRERNREKIAPMLASLRSDLSRPNGTLSWKQITSHVQRVHAAQTIGKTTWLRTISIVLCKEELAKNEMTAETRYLWTLRLLLERLSWMALECNEKVYPLISHLRGFEAEKLREYEGILLGMDTQIRWKWLAPCEVVNSADREELQLADLVASAVGSSVEPDAFGNVEHRYVYEMRSKIWVRKGGLLPVYGLKVHPAAVMGRVAYSWIKKL